MTDKPQPPTTAPDDKAVPADDAKQKAVPQPPGEIGGPAGPEPTRYGDWEVGGRCSDF